MSLQLVVTLSVVSSANASTDMMDPVSFVMTSMNVQKEPTTVQTLLLASTATETSHVPVTMDTVAMA